MKKNLFSTAAILSLLISACSTDNGSAGSVEVESKSLSFTSTIASATRVASDMFETGDEIYVTATDASTSSEYEADASYTYNGETGLFTSSSPIVYSDSDQTLLFSAIYPAVSGFTSGFTFTAETDQSSAEAYELSDLLVAQSESATSDICPELTFSHKMSSLVVEITSADYNSDAISAGTLVVTAKNTIYADLDADSYTATGDATAITALLSNATGSVIIAPQTISSGDNFLELTCGGSTFSLVAPGSFEFESGYRYAYSWDIATNNVTVTLTGLIDDWDDVSLNADE